MQNGSSCPTGYTQSSTYACSSSQVCCWTSNIKYKCSGTSCTSDNGDGTGVYSDSSCGNGACTTTTTCSCSDWSTCSAASNGTQTRTCSGSCPADTITSQSCNVITCNPACPANYTCTTSGCQPPPPPPGSCSLVSAQATSSSSGTATVSVNGLDRINWYLNGSFQYTTDASVSTSTSFSGLSTGTTYNVTAAGWCQFCTNNSALCSGSFPLTPGSGSLRS